MSGLMWIQTVSHSEMFEKVIFENWQKAFLITGHAKSNANSFTSPGVRTLVFMRDLSLTQEQSH